MGGAMKYASIAIALIAAGCVADRSANPNVCVVDDDCDELFECHEGYCFRSGGMDAGRDAGPIDAGPIDAGPRCTTGEPCYTGPEGTEGRGICVGGCTGVPDAGGDGGDGGIVCVGEVLPSETETCNEVDDDCDGMIDEGLLSDTATCGSCTTSCVAGEDCCETLDGSTHECANTQGSADHCGGCGMPCDRETQICCGGGCVDYLTDEANCGACNNPCGAGLSCCGGECIDPRSSSSHCGACADDGGTVCEGATVCCAMTGGGPVACRAETECVVCMPSCTGGQQCCDGMCTDVQENDANCGGCGVPCAANERCCGGTCTPIDDACGGCTAGDDCSATEICCGDACGSRLDRSNCQGCDVACTTAQTCCADGCVDLQRDNSNCGACDRECGANHCSNGVCCPTGQISCGGGPCFVPSTNATCGACGVSCAGGLSLCNCAELGPGLYGCRTALGAC
jgi:hypothetical protein